MKKINLLLLLFIFFSSPQILKATINVESTFSTNEPAFRRLAVVDVSLQADGKILLIGIFVTTKNETFYCIRLDQDGSFDKTFNPCRSRIARHIISQNDGKILISTKDESSDEDDEGFISNLVRLNSDGSLDKSFNFIKYRGQIFTITIQKDGKLLVGGSFSLYTIPNKKDFIRLNQDGSLDRTFRSGEIDGSISNILLQNDGKIIIIGDFKSYDGKAANQIARLSSDGKLDKSFSLPPNLSTARIHAAILQPDGSFIIGARNAHPSKNYIVLLKPDGSFWFEYLHYPNGQVGAFAFDAKGRLMIGGSFDKFGAFKTNEVARILSDGSIDSSFRFGTLENNGSTYVQTVLPLLNNQYLIFGNFNKYNGIGVSRLIRVNSDGSLDRSFTFGVK